MSFLCMEREKKMGFLREKIAREFGIPCFDPANGQYVTVPTHCSVPIKMSTALLRQAMTDSQFRIQDCGFDDGDKDNGGRGTKRPCTNEATALNRLPIGGVLVLKDKVPAQFMRTADAAKLARIPRHFLTFSSDVALSSAVDMDASMKQLIKQCHESGLACIAHADGQQIRVNSVVVSKSKDTPRLLHFEWSYQDDMIAKEILSFVGQK